MKDKQDLKEQAMNMAVKIGQDINHLVPESVSDMPYARQYVLEEIVRLLREAI